MKKITNEDIDVDAIYEEVLNELSKKTLQNYDRKASRNMDQWENRADKVAETKRMLNDVLSKEDEPEVSKVHGILNKKSKVAARKIRNRSTGILRAADRLYKEDIDVDAIYEEVLNELSKKTLGSYIRKAIRNLDSRHRLLSWKDAEKSHGKDDKEYGTKWNRKLNKRQDGIIQAASKLSEDTLKKSFIEKIADVTKNS